MRGRAIGVLILTGFGTVWMTLGLRAMGRDSVWTASLTGAFALLLVVMGLRLLRLARELCRAALRTEDEARVRRMFAAVNIIQWVTIAVAIVVLNLLHETAYTVPAIAIILGLHLYPLAASFRHAQHYVTGALLVGWAVACIALMTPQQVQGLGSVVAGMIVLVSAAVTVAMSLQGVAQD